MRVFKNTWFERFARRQNISDAQLCDAIRRADRGLIDADLGGGLIKQRVAGPGAGKSGGYRTLVFFRSQARAVFAFGFAKSDQANVSKTDELDLRKAAKLVLSFGEDEIGKLVSAGTLIEVKCDGDQDVPQ